MPCRGAAGTVRESDRPGPPRCTPDWPAPAEPGPRAGVVRRHAHRAGRDRGVRGRSPRAATGAQCSLGLQSVRSATLAPAARDDHAGVATAGEMALTSHVLAAGGALHDALSALGGVRATDPQKPDADRLRAESAARAAFVSERGFSREVFPSADASGLTSADRCRQLWIRSSPSRPAAPPGLADQAGPGSR